MRTIQWNFSVTMAGLAQLVERLTAEQEVMGSIPRAGLVLRVLTNGEMKVLPLPCKCPDLRMA